jgi:site-specific DNA-methyltransferase (adenine-specific)
MTAADWFEHAFFDTPERDSVDGGMTSTGTLWHGVSVRWGHSMQTMCSYHGMFPAKVAHYFIQRYSRPGDIVLDPFSGRGTVPLQARAEGRVSICNDLNPLAYVLSRAKIDPPSWDGVQDFLTGLEKDYKRSRAGEPSAPSDIRMLYHPNTLQQICYVRGRLLSKPITAWSRDELIIGGALAGIMHGSHRRDGTSQYLSISMPNTFSMSPTYVQNYIRENGLVKLDQDVFECLRDKLARLYLDDITGLPGRAHHLDATSLLKNRSMKARKVDLIVTSPPYLQVVNYGTANWIRLWLMGLDEVGRESGAGRKKLDEALDHRHTYMSYKQFLCRMLQGIRGVLKPHGVAVLIIGDVADPGKDPLPLAAKIWQDVGSETGLQLMELIEDHLPVQNKVSRIWGETKGQATARDCALVLARDDGEPYIGPEAIDWDEPYKDGGPDAAHARLNDMRFAS